MGYSSREENVLACLEALQSALAAQGHPVPEGRAAEAARRVFAGAPEPLGA